MEAIIPPLIPLVFVLALVLERVFPARKLPQVKGWWLRGLVSFVVSAGINALLPIIVDGQNQTRDLQQELARLALVEVQDALDVLSQKSNLNTAVQANLNTAKTALQTASTNASPTQRARAVQDALAALTPARDGLGTGMTFNMGPGTLMF